MMHSYLIVFAAAAAFVGAAGSVAFAEHGGRPANVPPMGSADLFFIDGEGLIRGFESGGPAAVDIFIFGWSFDGNNPNSPFVPSSPADTRTNEAMFPDPWRYAYNATTFTYDQINVEALNQTPNALVGPGRIAMFDDSTLMVTNSILRSQVIGAGDRSSVSISNSQVAGELQMRSTGSMTLSRVTPFERSFETPNLLLIAENGTTDIASSTLLNLTARGRASVTVSDSTIRNAVSQDRNSLDASVVPATTLGDTQVGSLSASIGTIRMTGGRVDGVVQASGVADDPIRGGGIFLDKTPVGGSVSASKYGTVTILESSINGNVTAGDSTNLPGIVRIAASSVFGSVQAVGSGILDINGFESIGALQASGDSRVTVSNGVTIRGNVFAIGTSQAVVRNVTKIEGDAFADNEALLELSGTAAGNVGAFTKSTFRMTGGSAVGVLADGGAVELNGVAVTNGINVFGKGRLTSTGSTVGGSITNFGDETGLVQVGSGSVGGDLVGLGSSITAMSGGFVRGSPVFSDQATFLYFGGTFGFFDTSPSESAQTFSTLRSGDDSAPSAGQFSTSSGFTAMSDATIKFIGFGLQSTLVDPDYVQDDVSYSVHQLTGQLADNSSIDGALVYIQNSAGTASFELIEVPEPSATALVIIGLSCVGFSRRAR